MRQSAELIERLSKKKFSLFPHTFALIPQLLKYFLLRLPSYEMDTDCEI